MKRVISFYFIVSLLLVKPWIPVVARAETEGGTVQVGPGKKLTLEEESAISRSAVKILLHIAQAREAIHHKDLDVAREALRKSMMRIEVIKSKLPTVKAKDLISVARIHLSYESAGDVLPDLMPIYGSLNALEGLVSVETARDHVRKAEQNLRESMEKEAQKELLLAGEALIDTETDLPLDNAANFIVAAYGHLLVNEPEKADTELKAAEKAVRIVGISIYSPLFNAGRVLHDSWEKSLAGRFGEAKMDLQEARGYLVEEFGQGYAAFQGQVQDLLKDTEAVLDRVEQGGEKTASHIKGLERKAKALYKRSSEYAIAGLEETDEGSKPKAELIEAKMHIAYADIYHSTMVDEEKAEAEMEQAESYLEKACEQVSEQTRTKIETVRANLVYLKKHRQKADNSIHLRYEEMSQELSRIIQNL